VRFEVADHPAAAVEEHHHRLRPLRTRLAAIEPHGNRAMRTIGDEFLHLGDGWDGLFQRRAEVAHELAPLDRGQRLHCRPVRLDHGVVQNLRVGIEFHGFTG